MRRYLIILHLLILVALVIAAILSPSVGGEGDTIMHFFWAKQATIDSDALFRSWAKPFFTFWASPWTYFGFKGIKVFNILCGVSASFFASLIALRRNWKLTWLLPLLAFVGPAYIAYLNTGLTEPFAALVLILGIYLLDLGENRPVLRTWAYLLLSFLPFCRSEAQVLLPIFALYALSTNDWKKIIFLAFGSIFYALVGSFWHNGDVLWIIKSPYVAGASVYGKGTWFHYLDRLEVMMSQLVFSLVYLGTAFLVYHFIRNPRKLKFEVTLLLLPALTFLAAHSAVWALGIYASAGLERVMIMIFPLFWLLIIYGLEKLIVYLKTKHQRLVLVSLIPLSIASSLSQKDELKLYYQMAFQLGPYQKFIQNHIYPEVKAIYPDLEERHLVSDLPYFSILSGHNPLDSEQQVNWQRVDREIKEQLKPNSLFLWDSHQVPFYTKIDEDFLLNLNWLKQIKTWEMGGRKYILLEGTKQYPAYLAAKSE